MATILVVEDDKLSQRILSKILAGAGHTIVLAESAQGGWETLREHGVVDLVILDNQLGHGWGWEFLESVRKDVLYQNLPVIVYTGHTERSSILKYVELGVHSMLVKPYKAEFIIDEIKKAEKADWTGRLLENPAQVCERLGIKPGDYYSALSSTASSLEENLKVIREAIVARRDDAQLRDTLQLIYDQSATLGIPVLRSLASILARAVATRNMPAIRENLQGLSTVQGILRRRSLAFLGLKDVPTPGVAARVKKQRPVSAVPDTPPSSQFEVYCRNTAATPMWALGTYLKRLGGGRLMSAIDLDNLYRELREKEPLRDFLEAFRFIAYAPSVSDEELLNAIKGSAGFEPVYAKIATRLGGQVLEEGVGMDAKFALGRLGSLRSTILIAAARVAVSATRIKSPLELTALLEHTLAVTLLAYEIGRMLRLSDEHMPAAAGLAHDTGTWVFAIGEPALYAAALGTALYSGQMARAGEREIFGLTHEEAGQKFLEQAGVPDLLQEAAAFHGQPEAVGNASAPALACVFLADHLAWASTAEYDVHARTLHDALLDPQSPPWVALEQSGVELPLDIPELLEAMIRVAKTTSWISALIADWAAGRGGDGEL